MKKISQLIHQSKCELNTIEHLTAGLRKMHFTNPNYGKQAMLIRQLQDKLFMLQEEIAWRIFLYKAGTIAIIVLAIGGGMLFFWWVDFAFGKRLVIVLLQLLVLLGIFIGVDSRVRKPQP